MKKLEDSGQMNRIPKMVFFDTKKTTQCFLVKQVVVI